MNKPTKFKFVFYVDSEHIEKIIVTAESMTKANSIFFAHFGEDLSRRVIEVVRIDNFI